MMYAYVFYINNILEPCEEDIKGDKAVLRMAVQSMLNAKYGTYFNLGCHSYACVVWW